MARRTGLTPYIFNDFRGGLNTKDGPFELKDNEAQALLNITLTERGAAFERDGKTRFDTSGFPTDKRAEHLRAWYPGSSRFLMASIDGDIFSCTTAGALTSRVDGTAGSVWHMEDMASSGGTQYLWAANGVDEPRRIDTAFTVTNATDATGTDDWNTGVKMMRVWRNRMVLAYVNSNRLRFSAIGNPESFGDSDFLDVKSSDDDNDYLTWLEILGDNMLVFKKRSVWSLHAEPPTPATRLLGEPGCEDRFQSCVVDGRCYFWSRNGVWSTDGVQAPRYESENIESYITDNLNFAELSRVRLAGGRDRRVFASIPIALDTFNSRLLEAVPYMRATHKHEGASERQAPWTVHDLPIASMCTFRAGNVDELLAGDSTDDELHRVFVGADDDGVPIESFWQSSWKRLVPEEKIERLRRVNAQADGEMQVEIYEDFETVPRFTQILTSPGGSDPLWDGGQWDGGVWNDPGGTAAFLRARPETRGRYHSVLFRGTGDPTKKMKIFAIELMARGGKEHT
jgi:hypothetical protein